MQLSQPSPPGATPPAAPSRLGEPRPGRRFVLPSLAIVLILLFTFVVQGARGIWERDEGRYTDIALNMAAQGDYTHPALNPETPHYAKPPVTYWLIAGALKLFGKAEWAARLPNTLAFFLTLYAIYGLGRIFVPGNPGAPVIVYGASILPLGAANYINADTLVTCFETLGMYLLAVLIWGGGRHGRVRVSWAAGAMFGLAFLTKGPPAWLPLLATSIYMLPAGNRTLLRRISISGFFLTAVVVGMSWFAIVAAQQPQLFDYFVYTELGDRVFSDRFHRNGEWYGALKVYVPTLLLGFLPWSGLLLGRAGGGPGALRRAIRRRGSRTVFLFCWAGVPLAVFFIAKSRLPLYILPIFVPLSLLVAGPLSASMNARLLAATGAASALFVAALLTALAYYPYEHDARRFAREISRYAAEPREIVFVSARPAYGLRFYVGAEIERIDLVVGSAEADRLPLAGELEETESRRLWLVPRGETRRFENRLQSLGATSRRLGRIDDFTLYEV